MFFIWLIMLIKCVDLSKLYSKPAPAGVNTGAKVANNFEMTKGKWEKSDVQCSKTLTKTLTPTYFVRLVVLDSSTSEFAMST